MCYRYLLTIFNFLLYKKACKTLILAVEKFQNNYSLGAKMVKEAMDKKFGAGWHCVIGEGFDAQVIGISF